MFFCGRCLHGYKREELLEQHKVECQGIGNRAIQAEMSEKGKNILTFQNHQNQLEVPYVTNVDFEAFVDKIEGPTRDPTKSSTKKTAHQEAGGFSYMYIVVRYDGQTKPPVVYRGPNAAEHLLECLQQEEDKIKMIIQTRTHLDDNARQSRKPKGNGLSYL